MLRESFCVIQQSTSRSLAKVLAGRIREPPDTEQDTVASVSVVASPRYVIQPRGARYKSLIFFT